LSALNHGPADDAHFALVLARQFHGDANAVNRGREAGEEELLARAGKYLVKARPHGAFAGRVAGAFDIGRVLQQRKHAALTVLGKRVQVECVLVERGKVDLEVAGMDDNANRSLDGQRDTVYQRVSDPNGLNRKGP